MDNKQLFAVEAHKNNQLYLSTNRIMASDSDGPPIQAMNMLETGNCWPPATMLIKRAIKCEEIETT